MANDAAGDEPGRAIRRPASSDSQASAARGLTLDEIRAASPPVWPVTAAEVAAAVRTSGRRVVVLDDDPTGTQGISGLPVLTSWTVPDLRWAFAQPVPAFFVLTNTRSLTEDQVISRDREVVQALVVAADLEHADFAIAVRGDSTLRGHYPLETDVVTQALLDARGVTVDGVIFAPAYIDAGRFTIDGVQWVRTAAGFIPVGQSEFARDPAFSFRASNLREYIEEKTLGRRPASSVVSVTLDDLRRGGPEALTEVLLGLHGGTPVVVDAACDEDLRILALAVIRAENAGRTLLYRVGPSFIRARAGGEAQSPLSAAEVEAYRREPARANGATPPAARHGLVVVGSHVSQTTQQVGRLRGLGNMTELEVDVQRALDPAQLPGLVDDVVTRAVTALESSDVVICTSRTLATDTSQEGNLAISQAVSTALVTIVQMVVSRIRPRWVVAKGGITSSDVATRGLGIRRAWVRGSMLPGTVSLWDPVVSQLPGVPYVVFAGNVGSENSLADVVTTLRG